MAGVVGTHLVAQVGFIVKDIEETKKKWAEFLGVDVPETQPCGDYEITQTVFEGKGMTIRGLFKLRIFWIAIVLMVCAGASELAMAQWASAFTEAALGFSKTVGDLVGPCLFAVAMGVCRVIYGKFGPKMDLTKFMIGSGVLCLCCYLLACLSSSPVLGLVGSLCGGSA